MDLALAKRLVASPLFDTELVFVFWLALPYLLLPLLLLADDLEKSLSMDRTDGPWVVAVPEPFLLLDPNEFEKKSVSLLDSTTTQSDLFA